MAAVTPLAFRASSSTFQLFSGFACSKEFLFEVSQFILVPTTLGRLAAVGGVLRVFQKLETSLWSSLLAKRFPRLSAINTCERRLSASAPEQRGILGPVSPEQSVDHCGPDDQHPNPVVITVELLEIPLHVSLARSMQSDGLPSARVRRGDNILTIASWTGSLLELNEENSLWTSEADAPTIVSQLLQPPAQRINDNRLLLRVIVSLGGATSVIFEEENEELHEELPEAALSEIFFPSIDLTYGWPGRIYCPTAEVINALCEFDHRIHGFRVLEIIPRIHANGVLEIGWEHGDPNHHLETACPVSDVADILQFASMLSGPPEGPKEQFHVQLMVDGRSASEPSSHDMTFQEFFDVKEPEAFGLEACFQSTKTGSVHIFQLAGLDQDETESFFVPKGGFDKKRGAEKFFREHEVSIFLICEGKRYPLVDKASMVKSEGWPSNGQGNDLELYELVDTGRDSDASDHTGSDDENEGGNYGIPFPAPPGSLMDTLGKMDIEGSQIDNGMPADLWIEFRCFVRGKTSKEKVRYAIEGMGLSFHTMACSGHCLGMYMNDDPHAMTRVLSAFIKWTEPDLTAPGCS